MQRYWLPGYEIQLLGELQKQQNNAQFCDTLLQTEGISVPAHSCILAALSPYFSQRLSASLSPPPGQKLKLQLPAVKAQTLLKLVGLLYSGVVEVKGSIEQNDLLSAARQFGITELVEGQKYGGMKEGELQRNNFGSCREQEEDEEGRESNESRKMQNAQVQTEMAGRRAADSLIEKRNCVSTGTQIVKAGEKTVGRSFTHSGQTEPPASEPACSSVAQCLDFSTTMQLQNITLDKHFSSACFTPIPSVPGGAQSDKESTSDQFADIVTNPISIAAWSSDVMRVPISLNGDSNSPTPQEDDSYQRSEFGDRIGTGLKDGKPNAKMADISENTEQSSCINRDDMLEEEKGNSAEKRHAQVGMRSLAEIKSMEDMMETAQISIKVKLRRRTKGEVWEVVRMQDADETLSLLTSLQEDGSNNKRPQTDPTNGERSSVQPGRIHTPVTQILQPANTNSPEPPEPTHPTPDSQLLCSDFLTPNQNEDPVEESDEQINKLLEDIMMGLNILPNLESDCKKSHDLHLSHDGAPTVCQVTATENERARSQMNAAVTAAECVYYQDIGTTIGHSLTNTAQNQPNCFSLSSEQSDAAVIQQQECSAQYRSSVTSTGQREKTSYQSVPLSKSQNRLYPEAPTTRSAPPLAFCSSGQKQHYPVCQVPSSQDSQNILEFLPLSQSLHSFSLPPIDDLMLPRCLSTSELFASAAKHEPSLNNSMNHSNKMQPRQSLPGRPWLAENTGSLQFPLSAIAHRKNASLSSSQDTNYRCWLKRQQKHLDLNPKNMGAWAESYTVKEVEEAGKMSAVGQSAAGVKSDSSKVKESSEYQQSNPKVDAAVPERRKRKRTSYLQDAAGSLLACKSFKVSNGTRSQSSPNICSVNLSSNNVLARERNVTISTSNTPKKCFRKLDETLSITDSWREKTRAAVHLNTHKTQIRTRALLKRTQENPSNASRENASVVKAMSHRAKITNNERLVPPKRKRGRPLKKKPEESPAAVYERKSHGVEREQQLDNSLLREEEEEGEKRKRRCRKWWRRNRKEVEIMPLKKTVSAESAGKAEADKNSDIIPSERGLGTPKQPWKVTLKDFQKLIKRQHSKTRKSKDSQDKETNESTKAVESEEMTRASRCEEFMKEKEMDITDFTQPQNTDGTEGSHIIFNVTVDKNHNKIFDKSTAEDRQLQQEDKNGSSKKESSLFGDGVCPLFSFDILADKGAKSAGEREQPPKNPDNAQKGCDGGGSDTTRQADINDKGLSHTQPQDDRMPSDHEVGLKAPQGTGPSLSDAVGFIKNSGCDQDDDEEEEQEEVEVDILLFSPGKVPQSSKCENGLENMDISPEEEEEEDVNEIDVTGDESESPL